MLVAAERELAPVESAARGLAEPDSAAGARESVPAELASAEALEQVSAHPSSERVVWALEELLCVGTAATSGTNIPG